MTTAPLPQHSPPDCNHLAIIKERCTHFMGLKFQPSMNANVATFLWPDFKELAMLSTEEQEEVKLSLLNTKLTN